MRYGEGDRESDNVEDRRGQGGLGFPGGRRGMPFPIPLGGGGLSLTSLLIIGAVCLMLGINPLELLNIGGGDVSGVPETARPANYQPGAAPQDDEGLKFVRRVLADTEDVWDRAFQAAGQRYERAKVVLFTGATRTECGIGQSAMGPFYCPLDRKVYIDLGFYRVLRERFRAPGEFAQAYVIAHEIGHHVQTLLGVAGKVQARKQEYMRVGDEPRANALQVRMELQADCLAGVWANLNDQVRSRLEPGDVEEGLNAASQIGDDIMQRRIQGRIVPDAFTHGSSAQRVRWFRAGLESGDITVCDTFNASSL
jgi:predicted metalloprotease